MVGRLASATAFAQPGGGQCARHEMHWQKISWELLFKNCQIWNVFQSFNT
jgi:hypothetical protein